MAKGIEAKVQGSPGGGAEADRSTDRQVGEDAGSSLTPHPSLGSWLAPQLRRAGSRQPLWPV